MSGILLTERDGAVTTLTLNRPDKRNALSAELVEALLAAAEAAATDRTRLLVIRGSGKGLSAGFDFAGIDNHSDGDLVLRFIRLEQLLQAIYYAPFATLALAHGPCYGAAADIVCCCSQRIAAPDATFRMPGLRFDIALGTRRLAETIGADAARRLLQASAVFDATEALACGFVNGIASPETWPAHLAAARDAAVQLPDGGSAMLYRQTRTDQRDSDLATLVRSAGAPGLKRRIQAFLAASARKPAS